MPLGGLVRWSYCFIVLFRPCNIPSIFTLALQVSLGTYNIKDFIRLGVDQVKENTAPNAQGCRIVYNIFRLP